MVAIAVSFGHGDEPVIMYWNVEVVTPAPGVNIFPESIPPLPVNLVQVPPGCSPEIIVNKSIGAVELLQTAVLPSAPAFAAGTTVTVWVAVPVQPLASETVTVKVVFEIIFEKVAFCALPLLFDHKYVEKPVPAFKVIDPP